MRVMKWLFITTTLFCILLWSGYYSIQTGYAVNTDVDSEQREITAVKMEEAGEKDFFKFKKYKKITTKPHNLQTPGIRATTATRGNFENNEASPNKRTRKILKTFKRKSDIGVSNNAIDKYLDNFRDTHELKSKIANKAKFGKMVDYTDILPKQTDNATNTVSSTTTEFDMGIKNKELDHAESDTVGAVKGNKVENGGSELFTKKSRVTSYQPVTQVRNPAPWKHARALGTVLDSRLEKEHVDRAAKPVLPANIAGFTSRRRTPLSRRRTYDIPFGSSTGYAVPDLQSLRLNKTENSTFVLLVTYARSGSTWLGEITNQANGTFYVFEPLQKFVVQGYYKEGLVCYNNNTCRKPRFFSETHNFAITTFHRLFTCQFTKLYPKAFNIFIKNLKSKNYARTFKSCFVSHGSLRTCQRRLEDICSSSTNRILKSIRISMELVDIMMDLWPNLKIIHLVRDPRGITSSRLNSKTFAMVKQLVPHSTDLCSRMFADVQLNNALNIKYINRLRLVFYESLTERPFEGAKFIYNFLNMKLTQDVMKWVHNSTHAQKKTGYFGTMRSDSVKSAYHWRTSLTLFKIKIIDTMCLDVYESLGFTTLDSAEDLINLSVPTRRTLNNLNWFS